MIKIENELLLRIYKYVALAEANGDSEAAELVGEVNEIFKESQAHFKLEEDKYRELGEEMAKIMSRKWWQFWKC